MSGNYRCLDSFKLRSISQSINFNINLSKDIYYQVVEIMKKLGAGREAIIPFKAYLKASEKLDAPSSVCRAIINGKPKVERVDRLVQSLGNSVGIHSSEIDYIVETIDEAILKLSN